MKKVFKELVTAFVSVALVAGLAGCPKPTDFFEADDFKNETAEINASAITWDGVDISDITQYAKPGAKLHLSVSNGNGTEYCKVLLLQSDWSDSGVTEAYYEGSTENTIKYDLKDNEENAVHRPNVEGEGEYYFVLNEEACEATSLSLFGNATVKKIYIEYVGGKKIKVEPTLENEDKYSKVIKLEKNTYAAGPETQVKIPCGFESVKASDKVVVKMQGASTKEFNAKLMIVDTTEAADYWKNLSEAKEVKIEKEFDHEFTFDITENQVGKGQESVMLVIIGVDETEASKLGFTEFSITKELTTPDPEGDPEKEPTESAYTEVWNGNVTLNWGDEKSRVIIPANKITEGTKAIRITYSTLADQGTAIKIVDNTVAWNEVLISAEGCGSSSDEKIVYLPGKVENQIVEITFKDGLDNFISKTTGNMVIYGDDKVVITKVEIVK